jgi:hypothetical protein
LKLLGFKLLADIGFSLNRGKKKLDKWNKEEKEKKEEY